MDYTKAEKARVNAVEAEAKRFLARVKEWRAAQGTYTTSYGDTFTNRTPKQSGAMKRASMDLTRALATLRKGDAR